MPLSADLAASGAVASIFLAQLCSDRRNNRIAEGDALDASSDRLLLEICLCSRGTLSPQMHPSLGAGLRCDKLHGIDKSLTHVWLYRYLPVLARSGP